jgi:hypothetical protein
MTLCADSWSRFSVTNGMSGGGMSDIISPVGSRLGMGVSMKLVDSVSSGGVIVWLCI